MSRLTSSFVLFLLPTLVLMLQGAVLTSTSDEGPIILEKKETQGCPDGNLTGGAIVEPILEKRTIKDWAKNKLSFNSRKNKEPVLNEYFTSNTPYVQLGKEPDETKSTSSGGEKKNTGWGWLKRIGSKDSKKKNPLLDEYLDAGSSRKRRGSDKKPSIKFSSVGKRSRDYSRVGRGDGASSSGSGSSSFMESVSGTFQRSLSWMKRNQKENK